MKHEVIEPRVPCDTEECFALGFLIGYLGEAPSTLAQAFPNVVEWSAAPDWITDPQAYGKGYEVGVSIFVDHQYPEDRS